MAELFHYDPLTGVTDYFDYDDSTDTVTIYREQDVEPVLRRMAEARASGLSDNEAKKDDFFCLYAELPAVVIIEMRKKGIDIYNKDHHQRMIQEIDENYPWLKATSKSDARPKRLIKT